MYRTLAVALNVGIMTMPGLAYAQRADTVSQARAEVFDSCPMTPNTAMQSERESQKEIFGALIGTLLAGIAGDLVKSGMNAAGDALEAASREQGFVAQGQSQFFAGNVTKAKSLRTLARFEPGERCLVLYLPDKGASIASLFSDVAAKAPSNSHFAWQSDEMERGRDAWVKEFEGVGITSAPQVYVEARILPGKEALRLLPTFVYYRRQMKGAPGTMAKSELHLSLATPEFEAAAGPGAIGSVYAAARIELPQIKPGDMLDWRDLRGIGSVWLPNRPTAGYVDKLVEAKNSLATQSEVKSAELTKADASLSKTQRLLARKPADPDLRDAVADAVVERDAAKKAAIEAQDEWNLDKATARAGASNLQMRLVVIWDANKFGLALAKALKGQAETAGKLVAEKLTPQGPKPEWTADKTAYLEATNNVEAKQRAYDAALSNGEASNIAVAAADLRIAKAKANEAAVKLDMALPYPALFGS